MIKNNTKLIQYYEKMQLDDSNKILIDYTYSYTLATMYKINLKDEYLQ